MAKNEMKILLGSDLLLESNLLSGKKTAVLANVASVCSDGNHIIDSLFEKKYNVNVILGPEHGLLTNIDYMEDVKHNLHSKHKIPVYSLYGSSFESLSPTNEMLKNIDILVCDLQDVGSRYYTYVWTLVLCIKVCARLGIKVIVCDRPNPIGGDVFEGSGIRKGFESFVGLYSLPNRHGMTIGEIANFINEKYKIGANLEIIKMQGWKRTMFWGDTGLVWIKPSPNMINDTTAVLYTGMCLLEGTNISEGRGTDRPFEIFGAPYFDSKQFVDEVTKLELSGVEFNPLKFVPAKDKWSDTQCLGVEVKIIDKYTFNSYLTGLAIVWTANRLYKNKGFKWRTKPYEFIDNILAIDLLTGDDSFRKLIDNDFTSIKNLTKVDDDFVLERKNYLFYA